MHKLIDGTPVEILGDGPLTSHFKLVKPEGKDQYLVFSDTLKYRQDEKSDPRDVIKS